MKTPSLTIRQVLSHGRTYYALYVPAALSGTGSTQRRLYSQLASAEAEQRRLRAQLGRIYPERTLSARQTADALQALTALRSAGVDCSLHHAVMVALPSLAAAAHVTCEELCRAYVAARGEAWAKATSNNFARISKKLIEAYPRMPAIALSVSAAESWLSQFGSPANRAAALRTIRPAWSWAVKTGLLPSSPWSAIAMPKIIRESIDVLSVDEAERLMELCPPELLASYALLLFAGIRPAEVERLKWGDVRAGYVHISPKIAKTAQARNVELCAPLSSLMEHLRDHPDRAICPGLNNRPARQLRAAAGILQRPDVARHSYASYWLALYKDTQALQLNLGHAPGSRMLWEHYRAAVTREEAVRYFGIIDKKAQTICLG